MVGLVKALPHRDDRAVENSPQEEANPDCNKERTCAFPKEARGIRILKVNQRSSPWSVYRSSGIPRGNSIQRLS
jgi:hypothetical protein